MASLDFINAQLPQLLSLAHSYSENAVEADLKRLFLDLFNTYLAAQTFDVNVLGAAHLGSFDLVRRAVNIDGLVLLQDDHEEATTRYLYRSWKSSNLQGRGLHFLRTYLQMAFPNIGKVTQLWQSKDSPYPTELYESEETDTFLTSRIRILINIFPDPDSYFLIKNCLINVIPARLLVDLRYLATSSIGKIQPISTVEITQTFTSSGVLSANQYMNESVGFSMAGTGIAAQVFKTNGELM